ncbi:DUF4142 domain-containing protein [Pedobacter deserti]|uniref:DUF4142 domain-containing protein n=1 Tax=Pedobacter deserti TaxID=2817382 RepID=UPI002109DC0F|nr:DUF4142 domain-containing protein [Pedobacter sp. SYSU D00382]
MRSFTMLFAAAVAVFSLSSCKDDDDNDFAMSNQDFVTKASSSNMFEIQAGALAMERGSNAAVRTYGEHMVTDHTVVGNEMHSLAAQKEWGVPEELLTKEQDLMDMLTPLTGAAFDREFARIMVLSHTDAVNLFTSASAERGVPDGDLRNWAGAKLPALKMHLQHATELRAMIEGPQLQAAVGQ